MTPGLIHITHLDTTKRYEIIDYVNKKMIGVFPLKKQYFDQTISVDSPMPYEHYIELIERMRTLPKHADAETGKQIIDGQPVLGYIIKRNGSKRTLWLHELTGELVRIEFEKTGNKLGHKYHLIVKDIEFNTVLDKTLFSIPHDYEPRNKEIDLTNINENDVLRLLQLVALHSIDGNYPPAITNYKDLMEWLYPKNVNEKIARTIIARGLSYILQMKPENNWEYAGKNCKIGTSYKPIAWWRPDNLKSYRVIYGDLSVKDIDEEMFVQYKLNFLL